MWTDEELHDDVVADWRGLLAGLLSLEPARDDAGRPRPRYIGIASDAKRRFIGWHDQHAREVADLADDHLRAHWSKLKGTCARIALLFACTEASTESNVPAVSPDCLERAIAITEWLKHESARVYTALSESADDRGRQRLLKWIEGRGAAVTVRDLTHGLWAFRDDVLGARAALDRLVKAGVGRWVDPPPGAKGGRPPELFELARTESSPSPKPGEEAP